MRDPGQHGEDGGEDKEKGDVPIGEQLIAEEALATVKVSIVCRG